MQTRNKIFDDISQLMTNAMGVAQGARGEAETAMKGMIDRWLADRDFVTRDEFDAVRAMAQKAREENEALKARLVALEDAQPGGAPAGQTRMAEGKATTKTATKSATKSATKTASDTASKTAAKKPAESDTGPADV